jgi:hypothetical protein
MNKTTVILGSLALLGVGAFLYFRPKAKNGEMAGLGASLTSGGTGASGTGASTTGASTTGASTTGASTTGASTTGASVPSAGTVLSTPAQVEDMAKKIAEARSLATKIADLKKKKTNMASMPIRQWGVTFFGSVGRTNNQLDFIRKARLASLDKEIKALDEQLAKLGYVEVNGGIVKLEAL